MVKLLTSDRHIFTEMGKTKVSTGFNISGTNPHERQAVILKMARIAQGKTLQEVGDTVGVTHEAVRLWESNLRAIDSTLLKQLAIFLNQDIDVFWKASMGFNISETNPHKRQAVILKMARIAQGKTLQEVGDAIGVTRQSVSLWENNSRAIDSTLLKPLAIALNQDVNVFWS